MKIDYSDEIDIIFNQESTSSCASNSLATILGFYLKKQGQYYYPLSRLYIYYNTRVLMNTVDSDSGSNAIKALEAIKKYGICPENMWSLSSERVFQKPTDDCYEFAKKFPVDLHYETFKISEQNDWIQTCMKYLCNGILLFCEMRRFDEQKIYRNYVESIPNHSVNVFYHAIVMIGMNEEEQYATFVNSHGYESFLFRMSFEQINNNNPIQDIIYVINCKFINNQIFNQDKVNAVYNYKNSDCIYQKSVYNSQSVMYQKVYDHIIIGSGITGKYLAYKLHQEYPDESILIVTNDKKNFQFTNTTVYVSNIMNNLICSSASNYYDIPETTTYQLIKDLNIDKGELELNYSVQYNAEIRDDKTFQKIYEILFQEIGINILDDYNFMSSLLGLFEMNSLGNIYYETFLELNGVSQSDIEYINHHLRRSKKSNSSYTLYYFILRLFGSTTLKKRKIKNVIIPLLEHFSQDFHPFQLGDFLYKDGYHDHVCLYEVNAIKYDTNYVELSKNNSSSSIKINCKNIYICNLDTFRNQNRLLTTNNYNVNIFLYLENNIAAFTPFKHEIWGTVNYISDFVINCLDTSVDFYDKIKVFMPIDIMSNVFYPININNNVFNLINDNKPISNIQLVGWVVYYYPYNIKLQQILQNDEKSLMDRMMKQLNCNGFEHHLNSNYSPYPLNIDGSFFMVDSLIKNFPKLGIIFDPYDTVSQEMNEIVGFNKLYLSLDELSELENFIGLVDVIIVSGTTENNFIQKLLPIVQAENVPTFFICNGFELLVSNEFPLIQFINCDAKNFYCNLQAHQYGVLSEICNNETFHDLSFGIKPDLTLFQESNYKIVSLFYDRNDDEYIACIENREFPIFGTCWHPFSNKTQNYLYNLQFLKNIIAK